MIGDETDRHCDHRQDLGLNWAISKKKEDLPWPNVRAERSHYGRSHAVEVVRSWKHPLTARHLALTEAYARGRGRQRERPAQY